MSAYGQVFPVELTQLPHLEKLYLDNNKLTVLPPELGELRSLRVLRVDNNMLISVPGKLFMSELPPCRGNRKLLICVPSRSGSSL